MYIEISRGSLIASCVDHWRFLMNTGRQRKDGRHRSFSNQEACTKKYRVDRWHLKHCALDSQGICLSYFQVFQIFLIIEIINSWSIRAKLWMIEFSVGCLSINTKPDEIHVVQNLKVSWFILHGFLFTELS